VLVRGQVVALQAGCQGDLWFLPVSLADSREAREIRRPVSGRSPLRDRAAPMNSTFESGGNNQSRLVCGEEAVHGRAQGMFPPYTFQHATSRLAPRSSWSRSSRAGGIVYPQSRPFEQRAREIFKQLIEINTTTSAGDTTIAAEAVAARLEAAGFPAADVSGCGRSQEGDLGRALP